MPNDPKIFSLHEVTQAMLNFRKSHGNEAYAALLKKFDVERFTQIGPEAFGDVLASCHAGLKGLKITEGVEDEDTDLDQFEGADEGTIRDKLTAMGFAANAKAADPNAVDLKEMATGKTDAERINSMGKFANQARRVSGKA